MCDAWLSIDYTASTASILNLFVLSLDRYWSITSPLKYLRQRTKRRASFMIAAAWLLSLLWILPVTGWDHMVNNGTRQNSPLHTCDTAFAHNVTFKVWNLIIIHIISPVKILTCDTLYLLRNSDNILFLRWSSQLLFHPESRLNSLLYIWNYWDISFFWEFKLFPIQIFVTWFSNQNLFHFCIQYENTIYFY